ncbi:MAG: OmpA family protein [Magnetovibrio sp.]|nr:OmpA family protein [Magnetovibrio sp.]
MAPPELTEEPDEEEWLVTYADAITLLMAFFVMLVSFSKIDLPMFEAAMAGIKAEIGMGKDSTQSITNDVKAALETTAFEMSMEQQVEVTKDSRGVVIEMGSTSFFKPGTALITDAGILLIKGWSQILVSDKFKYFFIEVEGHTDDDPINTPQFPSNWELSTARASSVVRVLESQKVQPFQLKVVGFGSSHPKVPNRDFDGKAISINQAKNRRIVIHLVQMTTLEKQALDDVLLEQRLAKEERRRAAKDAARRKAVQDAVSAVDAPGASPVASAPNPPGAAAPAPR